MNYSDRETERQFHRLEKRLKNLYSQSLASVGAEWDKYINGTDAVINGKEVHFPSLAERYQKEYKAYQDGKYTDAQFKAWYQAQIGRGERWAKMREDLAEMVSNTNVTAAKYINADTPSIFALNANYAAYEISKDYEGIDFTIYDESTVKNMVTRAGNYTDFRTVRVNPQRDYTWNKRKIENALVAGVMQGKSIEKITDSFMAVMQTNQAAAIRNARTAYTSAQNSGRITSMKKAKEAGVEVKKEWLATMDNRVRDSHLHLSGQIRDLDKEFDNGLMYPADPDGDPAEVYNCRCTLLYNYPKYNKSKSNESYKKWMESKLTEGRLKPNERQNTIHKQ